MKLPIQLAVLAAVLVVAPAAGSQSAVTLLPPPQGTQPDAVFAASYGANAVTNVSATTQRVSCYAPEVLYFDALTAADGYLDGGMSPCGGSSTTGEDLGPYATQDVVHPAMRVKDHSESDIRVDPTNPLHLIGQSKWAVSAEGYNHLNGFYESFDGGLTWPVQGHVPGYEGWTDNTDPVGAFDPYGNFYSLLLPYQFYYDKAGFHKYDNGSNQINPTVPPEAVSVSVHPHGSASANDWITTRNGEPDYVDTAKNANTSDPDKQWITIDTNVGSPHRGRIYVMWTVFVKNPAVIYESHADANPDGSHTDWTEPQELPTIKGKRWDSYLLPHVTPDGTVWTTITNNPQQQGFASNDIYLVWSEDGGATWQGPLPVVQGVETPTYLNTTFREGIVNTFAVGNMLSSQGSYPLYVSFEDGSSGLSNVYLMASYDGGETWTTPFQVNDNAGATEALQPNLGVAPNGTVAVNFYDRRLACPASGSPDFAGSGIAFDPRADGGESNYCINTAIQFYRPNLTPIGHNVRLSQKTWDPQLSALHQGCICSSRTFIGDYFGIDSAAGWTYTTSVSTFNHSGENPFFHQQQIVARIATP
jgi:BNR repeat-like domain